MTDPDTPEPKEGMDQVGRDLARQLKEMVQQCLRAAVVNDEDTKKMLREVAEKAAIDTLKGIIQEGLDSQKKVPLKDMTFKSGDLLDHARSLFQYHAGQRINSIRYFLTVFGALVVAYLSIFSNDPIAALAIATVLLGVTLCFFRLDKRNSELVDVDELALKGYRECSGM